MRYGQFRKNHRNWVYLSHFSTIFGVFGLILVGKPVRVTGKGPHGLGYG